MFPWELDKKHLHLHILIHLWFFVVESKLPMDPLDFRKGTSLLFATSLLIIL